MSSDKDSKGSKTPIIVAVITTVGIVAAAIIAQRCGKESKTPDGVPTLTPTVTITDPPGPAGNTLPIPTPTVNVPDIKPDELIKIIKEQQQRHVRASHGVAAGQNFSDKDLQDFIKKGVPAIIGKELETDNEFLDVVLVIKRMSPSERQRLFERGLNTYKPTWQQLGRIDPEGQTEAGQEAEKSIAKAIVDKVKELSKLPDDAIRKLYT